MIIPYQEHKITWVPSISMNEYLNDDPIDPVWIDVQVTETNVSSFGNKINNVRSIYCEVDIRSNRY